MHIALANIIYFKLDGYENNGSLNNDDKYGVNSITTHYERKLDSITHKVTLTAAKFEFNLSQDLLSEYDLLSKVENKIHFEHTYHLAEYSSIDDLSYDLNCWIIDAEKDALSSQYTCN